MFTNTIYNSYYIYDNNINNNNNYYANNNYKFITINITDETFTFNLLEFFLLPFFIGTQINFV